MVGPPAISPDGKAVVVALGPATDRTIWIRRFDTGRFERLARRRQGDIPFGLRIAVTSGSSPPAENLLRVPVAGGSIQKICSPRRRSRFAEHLERLGQYCLRGQLDGLYRVSDRGGIRRNRRHRCVRAGAPFAIRPFLTMDSTSRFFPNRPARKRGLYLYTLDGSAPRKKLAVTDQQVAVGRDPRSGREYALYSNDAKLVGAGIEPSRWQLTGEPIQIDEDVGLFSVSDTGALVIAATSVETGPIYVVRPVRTGTRRGRRARRFLGYGVAPRRPLLAFQNHRSLDGHFSIWLVDTARNCRQPFPFRRKGAFLRLVARQRPHVFYIDRPGPLGRRFSAAFVKAVDDAAPESPSRRRCDLVEDLSPDSRYRSESLLGPNEARSLVYTSSEVRPGAAGESGRVAERPHFSPDGIG